MLLHPLIMQFCLLTSMTEAKKDSKKKTPLSAEEQKDQKQPVAGKPEQFPNRRQPFRHNDSPIETSRLLNTSITSTSVHKKRRDCGLIFRILRFLRICQQAQSSTFVRGRSNGTIP